MKIIQINSVCGFGSTGRIAVDIADAAENRGHECYIAYGHGCSSYSRGFKIGNKVDHLFHNAVFTRLLGLHGYGSIIATILFTKKLDKIQPDVIHIHNIHANYLNFNILFKYIIKRDLPVVFTLHDCFNFTGKCTHYTAASCNKWQSKCGDCPIYNKTGAPSFIFDFSSLLFKKKKELYGQLNKCYVIAISKWLRNEAKKSILASHGHMVDYIYNWVDHTSFGLASDEEKNTFLKKFSLTQDEKYLISVSQEWNKSTIRYQDAVKLAHQLPVDYHLILVGKVAKGTEMDSAIKYIPFISDRKELAVAFSLAEAYIHFSIEDTFGLVIAEAMACGTIPITYDSTACAEVPGGYGIVVEPRNIDAIIEALPKIEEKKSCRDQMIQYVKCQYDKITNTNKYVDVYEKMLKA